MKTPLKVLIVWFLIVIALVVVVFYRYGIFFGNKNTAGETSQTQTTTDTKPTDTKAPETTTPTNTSDTTSVTQMSPKATQPVSGSPSLANGKKLFEEKTCVLCHGPTGKADTPTGQAMKATDLTGSFHNNKENLEATAYILKVIENGVPGTAMTSFKSQIPSEQDRKDLANYVHSLSSK